MGQKYNSAADTLIHIKKVSELLTIACKELIDRANNHDNSKLEEPEKSIFDKYTPLLASVEYGTEEYHTQLENLDVALQHHYKNNRHHPQYHRNGIDDMNLFDIIEMFMDWKAATLRTAKGDINESIKYNKERFQISDQLTNIFYNTVNYLDRLK